MEEEKLKLNWTIDYWESIRNRLHEESGLHYPFNEIGQMLELFFNKILNEFSTENRNFLDQGFLHTTTGIYLDERGKEMAMPRKGGKPAKGYVQFILTQKIPETETPTELIAKTNSTDGKTYDFQLDSVKNILNRINKERFDDENITTILEPRQAKSNITIPKGTSVYSDVGFEYLTTREVILKKGEMIITIPVQSNGKGPQYNTEENTIKTFVYKGTEEDNVSYINSDLIVVNDTQIKGGKAGESDDAYRQRLLNNINSNISVNHLKKQGVTLFSKKEVDDNIRVKLSSNNPYVTNKYGAIPPNREMKDYMENEMIINDWVILYHKGWAGDGW